MNVDTILVSQDEAQTKLQMYRDAVNKRRTDEDELLEFLYASVAKGARVINVHEAVKLAGLNEKNEPRMAIARADWDRVYFDSDYSQGGVYRKTRNYTHVLANRIAFPRNTFPSDITRRGLETIVPHIPIAIRPSRGLSLRYVLFEVQEWHTYNRDPYLLRRIAGNLFVVEAEWELTPLEASLLAQLHAQA